MRRAGTVKCDTQDLSTNTHIEKGILHYDVYGAVLIAITCPHSLWCSAGHFTSFSCGLCHTEAQSVQIVVLIKSPHCPPLLHSSWHVELRLIQFNVETQHLSRVYQKLGCMPAVTDLNVACISYSTITHRAHDDTGNTRKGHQIRFQKRKVTSHFHIKIFKDDLNMYVTSICQKLT